MKNKILNVLCSLLLVSSVSFGVTSCNNSTKPEQPSTTNNTRPSRKPQVSLGENTSTNIQNKNESVYTHGEIINLVDGSKLKYDENGNHELIEKGEGTVIIFKKVTQGDLDKLTPEQKIMVERQMKADPNGFLVIY